jgi:hypothetical protein
LVEDIRQLESSTKCDALASDATKPLTSEPSFGLSTTFRYCPAKVPPTACSWMVATAPEHEKVEVATLVVTTVTVLTRLVVEVVKEVSVCVVEVVVEAMCVEVSRVGLTVTVTVVDGVAAVMV